MSPLQVIVWIVLSLKSNICRALIGYLVIRRAGDIAGNITTKHTRYALVRMFYRPAETILAATIAQNGDFSQCEYGLSFPEGQEISAAGVFGGFFSAC
jgi:hypothetical protein